jgi:hypothetical protein
MGVRRKMARLAKSRFSGCYILCSLVCDASLTSDSGTPTCFMPCFCNISVTDFVCPTLLFQPNVPSLASSSFSTSANALSIFFPTSISNVLAKQQAQSVVPNTHQVPHIAKRLPSFLRRRRHASSRKQAKLVQSPGGRPVSELNASA